MVPDTPIALFLIRLSIWGLRSITPLSFIYWGSRLLISPSFALPSSLEVLAAAEIAFYTAVYLPRYYILNNSIPEPRHSTRQQRLQLFHNCFDSVSDVQNFLSLWFKGRDTRDIRRENVKELFAWIFFHETAASPTDDEELEEYLFLLEKKLETPLQSGRGSLEPMRVTTDTLNVQHRSLLYYIVIVGAVDTVCFAQMFRLSFEYHRLPLLRIFRVFPFRPLALLSNHISPAKNLSYWHRPHTSKSCMPVLFLHGIGIGLQTYTDFFQDLIRSTDRNVHDGQVGILAIEMMPVSFRICDAAPPMKEIVNQLRSILKKHAWDKFVLVAHSYGTLVATHLLRDPQIGLNIDSVVLVDPVTLSIHQGDIPYNFLYRAPQSPSEYQLHHFACTDISVAHTLTRRVDWTDNILWKDELKGKRVTVLLSGKDIIVDTERLGKYLSEDHDIKEAGSTDIEDWKTRSWNDKGLNIMWCKGLNHAEVFNFASERAPLVYIIDKYSRQHQS